jgi:hypothetical protein
MLWSSLTTADRAASGRAAIADPLAVYQSRSDGQVAAQVGSSVPANRRRPQWAHPRLERHRGGRSQRGFASDHGTISALSILGGQASIGARRRSDDLEPKTPRLADSGATVAFWTF